MSNAQAERAINQLYESDTVRSELRDEEASLLLTWGEARISDLAESDLPETRFEELTNNLRALLVAINNCVGKRKTMPSQQKNLMNDIMNTANAAGYAISPDDQTDFLQRQANLANDEAISELLGLLKPVEVPPSQPEAVPIIRAAAETVPTAPPPIALDDSSVESPPPVIEVTAEYAAPIPLRLNVDQSLHPQPPAIIEESAEAVVPLEMEPEPDVDNAAPPQPEELPELPMQPPPSQQEG